MGNVPAPYCVLMKIAQDILMALEPSMLLLAL
jgi:hypothetical protein